MIWGRIYHKEFEDHNNFERNVATNGYGGWSAHTPIQAYVDAYEMANGLPITHPASGYDPNHPYAGRDPRFYANIVYDDAMFWGRRTEFWDGGRDSNKGMPAISATGPALLKAIEHERRIELAFEFKRYWDLLRWKQAEEVLSQPATGVFITRNSTGEKVYDYDCAASAKCLHQQRVFRSHMYLFPIPNAEILRSPTLTQNPGY